MRHWFGKTFWSLSTKSRRDEPPETQATRVSHYERHLRQLDERAGRLFLP